MVETTHTGSKENDLGNQFRAKVFYRTAFLFFSLTLWLSSCSLTRPEYSQWSNRQVARFSSGIRPWQANAESYYRLGCYQQDRGLYREAISEFQKAASADPGYVPAYNGMAICYDKLKDFAKSDECYQKALKINPNLDYLYNNIGYSFLLQGDFKNAAESFRKAMELNGDNKRIRNNYELASSKIKQERLAAAETQPDSGRGLAQGKSAASPENSGRSMLQNTGKWLMAKIKLIAARINLFASNDPQDRCRKACQITDDLLRNWDRPKFSRI